MRGSLFGPREFRPPGTPFLLEEFVVDPAFDVIGIKPVQFHFKVRYTLPGVVLTLTDHHCLRTRQMVRSRF
ncbi:MAG: hypothetical protein KIT79_13470 [Deltaproteobacteria bacterium]|nr:hypothetical protein [Deltaproteobacteria bacterium]